jgi:predicted RNA-binding protein YlxR (DUF448 family)/ribosomal protein L7Ae-like RNA K-turn-binding protein
MMVETKQREPREPKGAVRTCAGCGERTTATALVRVVLDPGSGELAVDFAGSGFGHGAHVHAAPECLQKALKGGFARVFAPSGVTKRVKNKVTGDLRSLGEQILAGADRRIEGLVSGAKRARHLAIGSDLVHEALKDGTAILVVVARDAAAAAQRLEVQNAVAEGKAIAWSDKARLGALCAKDEVAVCAVLHAGVAEAITSAYQTSRRFRSEEWWSEVR